MVTLLRDMLGLFPNTSVLKRFQSIYIFVDIKGQLNGRYQVPSALYESGYLIHSLCICLGKTLLCVKIRSVQFSSVAQSCPTLCDPMNRSTPGLPVHHQLPEFTQTHVHRVRDAIQPSHPGLSPFSPAPSLSQHQSLFQ